MIITIAGKLGSGKSTIAKELAKKLNFEHYSIGDFMREIAQERNTSLLELSKIAEQSNEIDLELDKKQIKLGQTKTNFIIDSRIGFHFIPHSKKVFLDVDIEQSAKRIFNDIRDQEKENTTIEKTIENIKTRTKSEKKRYKEYYNLDHHNPEHFDIIINTTNLSIEKVTELVYKKIIDHQQLMNPPTFYIAHSTESRTQVREWEKEFEEKTKIELMNPFFDCNTLETKMGNLGKEKYSMLGEKVTELAKGDIEGLASKKTIGGIFIIDNNFSIGTFIEMGLNRLMGKLTYTLLLHDEKEYINHPFLALFSDKIFTDKESLINFLKENKKNLYKFLEQSRKKTNNDLTFQKVYKQIERNRKYQIK